RRRHTRSDRDWSSDVCSSDLSSRSSRSCSHDEAHGRPMSALAGVRSPMEGDNFSVVLGGPLYQIVRRAHLTGDALELLHRRIVVIALFAWLPLLILSVLGGRAWGDAVRVPFLMDVDAHARL